MMSARRTTGRLQCQLFLLLLTMGLLSSASAQFGKHDPSKEPREQKIREFLSKRAFRDAHCKGVYACSNNKTAALPAGSASAFEFTVPSLSIFQVVVTSTSKAPAPAPPVEETSSTRALLQAQPSCQGMLAVAFRAHEVPAGLPPPKADAVRNLLGHASSTAPPAAKGNNTELPECRSFWVPAIQLTAYARNHPAQVLQHATPTSGPVIVTNGAVLQPKAQDNSSSTAFKECGTCGSRVYVFLMNCNDKAGLQVNITLTVKLQDGPNEKLCYSKRDQLVYTLLPLALFFMLVMLLVSVVPLSVFVIRAVLRRYKQHDDSTDTSLGALQKSLRDRWRIYLQVLTTLHSPSGYSRLYTVTLVTTASLLVASTVWPPKVHPDAQHDHAWYDNVIAPRQSSYHHNKAHIITYYVKVMFLSALIGHTVKLALLSNLSPPDPGSRNVHVLKEVWKAQRVVSAVSLGVLTFLMGSSLFYMLLQWHVWTQRWAYWWLMAVIMFNFVVAVAAFVWYNYVRPPALCSEEIQDTPRNVQLARTSPATQGGRGNRSPRQPQANQQTNDRDENGSGDAQQADTTCCARFRAGCMEVGRWLVSIPSVIKQATWEEDGFRYSSWILTPVWLTSYLIIFWWLMGVQSSGGLIDCLMDPVQCFSNSRVLDYGEMGHNSTQRLLMLKQVLNESGQQTMLQLNSSKPVDPASQERLGSMMAQITSLSNEYNFSSFGADQSLLEYQNYFHANLVAARQIGQWLGYSVATVFAIMSLMRIVASFKSAIKAQSFWDKYFQEHPEPDPERRRRIVAEGGDLHTMQNRRAAVIEAMNEGTHDWAQYIFGPAAPQGGPPAQGAPPAETPTSGLSTKLARTIQEQQEELQVATIGPCIALFGVMISTMWIQIRLVGFLLALAITILGHPLFRHMALEEGWVVAIVCLVVLVIFNILVLKRWLGNVVLSDGRNIKHPGTWMTFFLMFQLGFMVIGVLYSLWRVLLALLIMLLYSVAALDRSLLFTAQFLDGPYKAFLSSVKLESAYRAISEGRTGADCNNDTESSRPPARLEGVQVWRD